MFERQVFVSGVAAAMVFVGFALAPANADFNEPVMPAAKQTGVIAMAPLTSAETPQDQVWDMTFGTERASGMTVETVASVNDEALVDYTFG